MNAQPTKIKTFTDLNARQEAHKLILFIYQFTKKFLREELFGLVSQMRRAAISITSNIAEGFSRQSYKEKIQFYCIAESSNTELQNQLIASKDIGYLVIEEFDAIFKQGVIVHKLLNGLIKKSKFIHNS
jgi:four helix bundle protein